MFLGVRSIGALPEGSPYGVCTKEYMLHFQILPLHVLLNFYSSQYRSPFFRFTSQSSHRQRRSVSRVHLQLSLNVTGKGPNLQVP